MHTPLSCVLIGCGAIANKHMAALSSLDSVTVKGVYDMDAAVAAQFSAKYGIPAFTSIEEMIETCGPDFIDILTPSGVHALNIFEVIPYNRHIVVEKPLALRLEDIDAIISRCDAHGIQLFVVQQNRFNPPIQKCRQALEKGRFGKLVLGTVRVRWTRTQQYYDQKEWRGTWAFDGGVIANQALHHVDMLQWMMGDVQSVFARTARALVDIETEDTAIAALQFTSGALGIIEATTAVRPRDLEGSLSILGERGSVEIGGFFMNELKTWNFSEPDPMDETVWQEAAHCPNEYGWSHARFFEDVIHSIRTRSKGLIDGFEGRKSVELVNGIYESAETGNAIPIHFKPRRSRLGMRQ